MLAKWPMFIGLYKRDMEQVAKETLGLAGVALVIILLSLTPWTRHVVLVPFIIVTGAAMFLPLLTSILSLYQEWRGNTIYLLLSLPVGGSAVLGAKLLAALTQVIINGLVVTIMGAVSMLQFMPAEGVNWDLFWTQTMAAWQQSQMGLIMPYIIIIGLLSITYVICGLQLGLLMGRLFRKFTALATFIGIVAVFWVSSSVLGALAEAAVNPLRWHPGMPVPTGDLLTIIALMLGIIVLLFSGTVYIFNHRIEV